MPSKQAKLKPASNAELVTIIDDLVADLEQNLQEKHLSNASRCIFAIQDILTKLGREADQKLTDLLAEHKKQLERWKKALKVEDKFETFSVGDKKWFIAKILSKEHDGRVFVKYIGWQAQYNEVIDISDREIHPEGTLIPVVESANKKRSQTVYLADEQSTSMQSNTISDDHTSMETTSQQPPETTDEAFEVSARGRKVRKLITNNEQKKKRTLAKRTIKDHNDWNCTNCGMLEAVNGSDLVMCDGPCKRSFHQECMSSEEAAKHEALMDSDENADWFCWQCRTGRHDCFICGRDGINFWVSIFQFSCFMPTSR